MAAATRFLKGALGSHAGCKKAVHTRAAEQLVPEEIGCWAGHLTQKSSDTVRKNVGRILLLGKRSHLI